MKHLAWILALVASNALAADLVVTWTNPITYTDGTAFPASDFQSVLIQYGLCPDGKTMPSTPAGVAVTEQVSPLVTTYTVTGVAAGTYCVQLQAVSISGGPSAVTNVASGVVTSAPGAPAIQNVSSTLKTTGTAVYLATMIPNGWSFLQVGTVPVGTPCMAGHGIEGYNVILQGPGVTVTWAGTLQPLTIVALCQ